MFQISNFNDDDDDMTTFTVSRYQLSVPMKVGGDCVGYGSVLQALAHRGLGPLLQHWQLSESGADKRRWVGSICGKAGFPLGHGLYTREAVDFYEAGYPCQPFWPAGCQRG